MFLENVCALKKKKSLEGNIRGRKGGNETEKCIFCEDI